MKPAFAAALVTAAVAGVAAVGALGSRGPESSIRRGSVPVGPKERPLAAPCPEDSLPDDGVCIPVPAPRREARRGTGDRIPRVPDRPPDYAGYELPVRAVGTLVDETPAPSSGDAGLPESGLSLRVAPGTTVAAVALEGQDGPARVVFAGELGGAAVVTLHVVHQRGRERSYVVVVGNLARVPPLAPHAELAPGTPLGEAGRFPLAFDVRRLREGADAWALAPADLLSFAASVREDPRNVLRRNK